MVGLSLELTVILNLIVSWWFFLLALATRNHLRAPAYFSQAGAWLAAAVLVYPPMDYYLITGKIFLLAGAIFGMLVIIVLSGLSGYYFYLSIRRNPKGG